MMDADFDPSQLGAALWRNKGKILRPTIAVALITFAVVMLIPPKYLGESRVLVVGRDNAFLRPDVDRDTGDRGTVDLEAVTSQAQLILSRDLATEVINKLKLNERREFNSALGGVSLFKTVLGFIGLTKNPLSMTPQERVLDAYYDRLNVYPVEKSRVIVIDFLSENPELAARVANAIADAYLERQQLAKQEQVRGAGAWLAGEIEKLRKKVEEAEARVEAFRGKTNLLVGPNGTTLSAQQLGEMNAQLGAARTLKADAEAKAKLIRQMLKASDEIQSSDVLNSELIRRLSEQRVTLRAQLAEQSSSLLDNHPRIKELKAQIADLDQQIRHEAEIGGARARKRRPARQRPGGVANRDARAVQEPGVLDQRAGRAIARAGTRGEIAARSAGIVFGQISRGHRPRQHCVGAAGCPHHFARLGVERSSLSEKASDRADRHLGDLRGLLRYRGDPRVSRQSGNRCRRAAGPRRSAILDQTSRDETSLDHCQNFRCGRARGRASVRDRPLDGAASCCGEKPAAGRRAGERDRRIRA